MNATAPPDDPVIHHYDSDYPSATHNPYPENVDGSPAFRVSGSILVLPPLNESTAVEVTYADRRSPGLQARGILAREPIEDGQAL